MSADLSIYLVTDRSQAAAAGHDLADLVAAAVAGGVTAVQVREKQADAGEFLDTVLKVAAVLPEPVALFVNDRVDVFLAARRAGARVTGVHVGQQDLPVAVVRELVGPDALIGLTANTPTELFAAGREVCRVDYVGIGSVHATASKADAAPALGVDGFAELAGVDLPARGGDRRRDRRRRSRPAGGRGGRGGGDLRHLRGDRPPRSRRPAGPGLGGGCLMPAPRVLCIAGTDPSGGAGLLADLKSVAANGGYGMGAVTALTAQNTRGVRGVHVPPAGVPGRAAVRGQRRHRRSTR